MTVPSPEKLAATGPSLTSMWPVILPSCGGPSRRAPGMHRATASASDINAQTASRGCSSTKDWERRMTPSVSSILPVVTRTGARAAAVAGEGW